MKYGLNFPNGGDWADARTLSELSLLAEQAGWDGVFLEDYIVWQSRQDVPTFDPWVSLAAIAQRTERIRLGTTITPLARRRPWKIARETVSLDHLSNGRLILGVGLGDTGESVGSDASFTKFGEEQDTRRRAAMLDEALEVLVGLWSGEPFSYQGGYYQVEQVTFLPRPIQDPRIPIWVGGAWPLKGPVERAARWDGACLYKQKTHYMLPEDIRSLKDFVASRRDPYEPYDIVVGGAPRRADWEEEREYIRQLAQAGATWWLEYLPPETGSLDRAIVCIERGPLRIE